MLFSFHIRPLKCFCLGCDMKMELQLVKKKIYQECVIKKNKPIYDPDCFREFCISAGAKRIFDTMLNSVSSSRHSEERLALNKKRVVTVIYKMSQCLSQMCNPFAVDHSLYLKGSQINQEGIETEHILGNSCSRRTVNKIMHTMADNHHHWFENLIKEAIANKWLLVLIIDDYTAIHSKRRPQNEKLSECKSMCTIVVKAFKNIPAIEVKQANIMHDCSGITIKECENIITSSACMHDLSNTYASVMPDWMTEAFFNPDFTRQRINTHKYCDNDNTRTMRKMDNLYLLDFIELRLKSKDDFDAAYDVVMSTGLANYTKEFVVLQPGDWPCQFYCRQNIYQYLKKFNPGSSTPPEHSSPFPPDDHSAYSYSSARDSGFANDNIHDNIQQPSFLSIIPTIGPLHISLNSREHIVNSFHPFFKLIYERVFPKSKLAANPKPWRISLLLEIVYGGWTLIRQTVLNKFSKCKNLEYGTLFNLLDNYIPLVLSIYSISFKLNNFTEYFRAMIRIWVMFTCLKRRHYNKAPLVWINMCSHWGKYAPQLYELLQNHISIFDEYPVENTHSILRAQTNAYDSAEQLRKKAQSIFQSKERQSHFRSFFTAPKQFSFSQQQLHFLKVRCAQILSSMLMTIPQSPVQIPSSRNRNSTTRINLPTICPNEVMKTTVLPLGYHGDVPPDQTKTCDLPECQVSNADEEWIVLNGCFHSFHIICLDGSTFCPLCKSFLQKKVNELGGIAKEAILNPASDHRNTAENDDGVPDATEDDVNIQVREMEMEEYNNIIEELNSSLANMDAPLQPSDISNTNQASTLPDTPSSRPPHCRKCCHPVRGHKRSNSSQITCDFCPNNICVANVNGLSSCICTWHRESSSLHAQNTSQAVPPQRAEIQIPVTENNYPNVTEWVLPFQICQSNIAGRQFGSNACTVIALLSGLHFLKGTFAIPKLLPDLNQTLPVYSQLIHEGNQIYDSFNMPPQQPNLDVRQVLQQNNGNFQGLRITSDTGFFTTQDLEDFLIQTVQQQQQSFFAVLIVPPDKSLLLCFSQTSVCLFESHSHGLQGGIISTGKSNEILNFVHYLEIMVNRDWGSQLMGSNITLLQLT